MRYSIIALLIAFTVPITTAAAFDGVLLKVNPENPNPGDRVTVTATLVGGGATESTFVWTVNGERVAEGGGLAQLAVDAPALGGRTDVAVAVLQGGAIIGSGNVALQPAVLHLEWEGSGYVPPFYLGKPLTTAHGTVRVVAVPDFIEQNGLRLANSNILYTWRLNGIIDQGASGYGRNTFQSSSPFFDSAYTISVHAVSRDKSLAAENTVFVRPQAPQPVVYEYTPLGGVEDTRAVTNTFSLVGDEVSFVAYPLFIDESAKTDITWLLNGQPISIDTGDPRVATFKRAGAGEGSIQIGVLLNGISNFLDKGARSFLLHF